jgi:uncharacterized membrane protein YfhO
MENKKRVGVLKYIVAFCVPVMCLVFHMVLTCCYPFGNNTILLGDSNAQYYSFFMELSDRITEGKSIFFSLDKGLGYDFYSNFFYYLSSPFNVIALAFGKSYMELGMVVTMAVQVGLCAVTMTYFLYHTKRNTMERKSLNSVLCVTMGIAYSLCNYVMAYQYNIMWLVCLMLAPLVCLGVERLIENGDVRLYFVTLLMCFVFNFYFSWFICILAVVWFIDVKKDSFRTFIRRGARFALTSIVSAFSSAVVLVPCFLAVMQREDTRKAQLSYGFASLSDLADFIQSFFWGFGVDVAGSSTYGRNSYVGVVVVLMAMFFVVSRNIDRMSRVKRLIEIVVFTVFLNWGAAIYVLHGFTFPHMYTCRFQFILVILLLVSAFECLANYEKINYARIAIVTVAGIILVAVVFAKTTEVQSMTAYMVTLLVALYMIVVFVFSRRGSIKNSSVIINVIVLCLLELITNSVYSNMDNYSQSKDKLGVSSAWSGDYDSIESDNLERKTSWMLSQNNTSYSETNLFSSSMNTSVLNLFNSVGLVYQANGGSYAYRGSTPVTSVMFNVRNVLTDVGAYYGGYSKVTDEHVTDETYGVDEDYGIYETEYIAGLGFMVHDSILNLDTSNLNPFQVQNDFVYDVSGVEDVFTEVNVTKLENYNVTYHSSVSPRDSVDSLKLTQTGKAFKYLNISLDNDNHPYITVEFDVPEDMELYMHAEDAYQLCSEVYVDDQPIVTGSNYPTPSETINIGKLSKGQHVKVNLINLSTSLSNSVTYVEFYQYDDEKMQQCLNVLKDVSFNVDTVNDTYISGEVNATEEGVLYTSIPYYRGFTAYVDGEKANIIQLADGALIGIHLSEGEHTVEFRYSPYGFKIGLALSVLGVLIVAAYILVRRNRRVRDKLYGCLNKDGKARYVKYVVAFSVPVLCFVAHMIITKCWPFGTNTVLLGDGSSQYYAFFTNLSDRIKNGDSIFFSWDSGMGFDYYVNFFYYLSSPFNIIALCFGKSYMELGIIVTMIIQVGACGIAMTYYLAHTTRNNMQKGRMNDALCAMFGVSYALCDYLLAYQFNIMWLICLILAPVMLLGMERLVRNGDVRLYFVTLALAFIFNFYFSWFLCLLAILWFIDIDKGGAKQALKKFVRFAVTSVVAAMSGAVVLVPCYYANLTKGVSDYYSFGDFAFNTLGNMANYVQSFFWKFDFDYMGADIRYANSYQGICIVLLAVLYLLNKNISLKQRLKRLAEIIILAISLNWAMTIYIFHGFTYPHLFCGRFSFILTIVILISAFEYICSYRQPGYIQLAVIGLAGFVLVVYAMMKCEELLDTVSYIVTIAIMIYVIMLFVLEKRKSIKMTTVIVNLMIITFAELITNALGTNLDNITRSVQNTTGVKYWQSDYDNIEGDAFTRKTSWMRTVNSDINSDVNIFASTINTNVHNLFGKLGLNANTGGVKYNFIGATPVTSMMFNVRNVLTDEGAFFGGYTGEHAGVIYDKNYEIFDNYGVYETEYVLGPGFMVPDDLLNVEFSSNVFENNNIVADSISNVSDVFTQIDEDDIGKFAVAYNNCVAQQTDSDNSFGYVNTSEDSSEYPCIEIQFTVQRDMNLYINLRDRNDIVTNCYIDGEALAYSDEDKIFNTKSETICLGDVKAGQSVYMQVYSISDKDDPGEIDLLLYEYHDDRMRQCMDSLSDEVLNVDTVEDTYVRGTITAKEDGILYTSIPYYKGFTAYVDGEKVDIVKLFDGALIGLDLTAGEHTIELKYITYGFWPGLLVSIIGISIAVIYVVIRRREHGKKEK